MGKHRSFSRLNSGLTGRDHYSSTYSDSLKRQIDWLRRGANQKANAICMLLNQNGLKPSSILEVGCGTGAIIAELQRRGVAKSYHAIDYSAEAIAFVKKTLPNVHSLVGDIVDCATLFGEHKFDLIICSHVLEHLENPERFLRSLSDLSWTNLLAEVPLENLFFGRIKGRLQDRGKHPAGHVQFFDKQDFLTLLSNNGMDISDEYVYAPFFNRDTIKFAYSDGGQLRHLLKMCTEHYFPKYCGALWAKFYHAHMTVLCKKNQNLFKVAPKDGPN